MSINSINSFGMVDSIKAVIRENVKTLVILSKQVKMMEENKEVSELYFQTRQQYKDKQAIVNQLVKVVMDKA